MKESKEKSKALNLAIEKLEKTYGKGTIMKLSDENIVKIPSIPTGSLSLDISSSKSEDFLSTSKIPPKISYSFFMIF